jgi:hypothetical protein
MSPNNSNHHKKYVFIFFINRLKATGIKNKYFLCQILTVDIIFFYVNRLKQST